MFLVSDAQITSGDEAMTDTADHDRWGRWIERADGRDFPFYDKRPVNFTTGQWAILVTATLIGVVAQLTVGKVIPGQGGAMVASTLFLAIPLVAMHVVSKGSWRRLFHRPQWWDVPTALTFVLLNLMVSLGVNQIVSRFAGSHANPAASIIAKLSTPERFLFLVSSFVGLIAEEVMTIIPMLAIMYFLLNRFGMSRKSALVLAWVLSALFFGAAHLPSYQWNLAQAFLTIGAARLVLSLAYIRTKNLWVSAAAHITFDFSVFIGVMLATA